ncbi:MAG: 1-acyl-sn-glycerol-3-phosphate acyltransferase [Saprospiraceae bacterium]|uniref:1-acyl-sn-glycerol-3-phosphate acyltransferase n=1 Tax=Candidatus Opimibacter skivensis TaxID=2982028 RepID=A0A9D7SVZ3_9BACT|nr:1-acyl-sn-glycerol-3-phosphate acyltransferase [Candidatus Opimibacter skivensis]
MIYAFIRLWATIFLRLYFRKTIIYGDEKVPLKGPLILASNHPSAFLEASVLSIFLKRPLHYLVRGDMFNPKFQWLFDWTNQIPIYRKKDGIANLRKNASSFDLTYKKLSEGEAILIFPEAKTVLEKKMRPIQRGTAHLAFGTLPFIQNGEELFIQPVGVNFTEPRLPGTDVVIKFGEPFLTQNATREDRDAIEEFTDKLSHSMDALIIQVDDALEKKYDVLASIYLRMMYENNPGANAHQDLQKIAGYVNGSDQNDPLLLKAGEMLMILQRKKNPHAAYFPDLIVMNRMGLATMTVLKCIWLIAGGWIWRVLRNVIFKKITTSTFQTPTTVGAFMVVMPLMTIILLVIFIISDIPLYFVLIWLFVMWLGTLIRPPLHLIWGLLVSAANTKTALKKDVFSIRDGVGKILS